MHLLIFTPTWKVKRGTAIWPECRRSIREQQIDGDWTWRIGTDNPHPIGDHRNVLHQYQQAQAEFLAGSYATLLTVEHDMALPDSGAVQRMIDTPGDVVYAPYLLRHGLHVLSTWQYINNRNLGMSLSNYPDELRRARQAGAWRICGAGFGCTLFRRRVLEALAWTHYGDGKNWCPDLRFATDALRAGFNQVGRFDVPVSHRAGQQILHPFGGIDVTKYLSRVGQNAILAGRFVVLRRGEEIDLTPDEAADAARLGFIDDAQPITHQAPIEQHAPETPMPSSRRNRARALKDD